MISPVRGRSTFDLFRTEGRRLRGRHVRVTAIGRPPGPDDRIELAFVLPRRFGTAVERNRSRRRVREALREALRLRRAQDPSASVLCARLLISPSRRSLVAPFAELVDDLGAMLEEDLPAPGSRLSPASTSADRCVAC
ncbi:MAG: ribonuclease P protein component [Acidimicrobiales bacterium]